MPFEIGQTIVIKRIINGIHVDTVTTKIIDYYRPRDKIDAVLYMYEGGMTWEYFRNCRKLTKLERALK